MPAFNLDDFVNKVGTKLQAVADDLTTLSVVTLSTSEPVQPVVDASGKPTWDVAPPAKLSLIGRTEIQLDGDIFTVVPMKDGTTVNTELFEVHKGMVTEALKQRAQLIEAIVGLLKSLK